VGKVQKCEKFDANVKCECDAKAVQCDAMLLKKSTNANAMQKSFALPSLEAGEISFIPLSPLSY
jgi:hypothetical protein